MKIRNRWRLARLKNWVEVNILGLPDCKSCYPNNCEKCRKIGINNE